MNEASHSSIELTVFDKTGGPLTKRITLTPDGKIASDGSACTMARGRARRVQINSIVDLAPLIEQLTSSQAIALGALRDELPDEVDIVTKRALAAGASGANNVIARTAANLSYRPGRATLVLFDYDTKGMTAAVEQQLKAGGGFWLALTSVVPKLAQAGHLLRLSTSAGLSRSDTGEKFPGSGGLHGYVVIADGIDAVRFLTTLHARCWLAGYGWYVVGRAGQLLERSIVDRMVGAAERLVFEGPPQLVAPLQQNAAARRPTVVAGEVLDSIRVCPPLTALEQQAFEQMRVQEKLRLAPECAAKRAAWIAARTAELAQRLGIADAAAVVILEKQTRGLLLVGVVLPFDDPDLAGTTVGDVLDDPARFEGETLADPLDGPEEGICKAKIMLDDDGMPFIHSFAGGRTIYRLAYDVSAVRARIERATDAVAALVKLTDMSDLNAIEVSALEHEVAGRAKVSVRAVKATLKAAAKERQERRKAAARERAQAARTDPRLQKERPAKDAEWLPVIGDIHTSANAIELPRRMRRNVDGTVTQERRMAIARTHPFSNANEPEEKTDD